MPDPCYQAIVVSGRRGGTPTANVLRMVDVSDPQSPATIASFDQNVPSGRTNSRVALWVAKDAIGLPGLQERHTVGISVDSAAITMTQQYAADLALMADEDGDRSPATGLALVAGATVTSSLSNRISVVDFRDPTTPAVLSTATIGQTPRVCLVDGVVGGDLTGFCLSVSSTATTLRAYDIDDPSTLSFLYEQNMPVRRSPAGLCHMGGGILAAALNISGTADGGLRMLSVTRSGASVLSDTQFVTGNKQGAWAVSPDHLLVGHATGLLSFDVSVPATPVFLQQMTGVVPKAVVKLAGDYIAVADDSSVAGRRLAIVNVSNPAAMFVDNYFGLSLPSSVLWVDGVYDIGSGCATPGGWRISIVE